MLTAHTRIVKPLFCSIRSQALTALMVGLFVLSAGSLRADDGRAIIKDVARAYGIDGFYKAEKIVFSFNVQLPGSTDLVTRTWIWRPQSSELTYIGLNKENLLVRSSFFRNELASDTVPFHKEVDQWFVNDSFWLLFPLMVVWDESAKVSDAGMAALPMGGGQARRLVVTYPPGVGYTPGDVYELYIGSDKRILQWVFRKGGATEPTMVTTWDEHTRMGPLLMSLSHQNKDGSFKLWFSNVVVTSREDGDAAIPSVSEFTAMRYQAESEVAIAYREQQRETMLAEQRLLEAEEAARVAAEHKAAAEVAAKNAAAARATELAANQTPTVKTPAVTTETPAVQVPDTTVKVDTAKAKREAEAAAKAKREAEAAAQEAERLAAKSQREAELAAKREAEARAKAEQSARDREAERLAALERAQSTNRKPDKIRTVKPTRSSSSDSGSLASGLDGEVDPEIVVGRRGDFNVQGYSVDLPDVKEYLKAVAKRNRDAPVTIRLDSRYDNAAYINLMNVTRDLKLKNLVVLRSR